MTAENRMKLAQLACGSRIQIRWSAGPSGACGGDDVRYPPLKSLPN